jgi:hypothetical protein
VTPNEAHALCAQVLPAEVRVRFVQGRNRAWWAIATHATARDPEGNVYDYAERLGFLTPVTAGFFARDARMALEACGVLAPPSPSATPAPR